MVLEIELNEQEFLPFFNRFLSRHPRHQFSAAPIFTVTFLGTTETLVTSPVGWIYHIYFLTLCEGQWMAGNTIKSGRSSTWGFPEIYSWTCSRCSYCRWSSPVSYLRLLSSRARLQVNESEHDKTTKWSVRPAKTQISLGIRPVWSESSLSAWRNLGSLASYWARMRRLNWVFAGRTCNFVGFVVLRLK